VCISLIRYPATPPVRVRTAPQFLILLFSLSLCRSYNGQIIPSERPGHMLLEAWNPLGVVGVISAFNFPCAVYGWNNALALITGNALVWKPAPSTPLTAIAVTK